MPRRPRGPDRREGARRDGGTAGQCFPRGDEAVTPGPSRAIAFQPGGEWRKRSSEAKPMLLIRHGESIWNQERRIQGNLDPDLSDRGRAQAELLAERLKGRPFAALYTSPLRRALDTATILGESAGLAPRSIDGLREIRLGEWEGKTATEIRTASGDLYDRWLDRPLDVSSPPGGEEIRAFSSERWAPSTASAGRTSMGASLS